MERPWFMAGFATAPIERPPGESFWWVECFACDKIVALPGGAKSLPDKWATIVGMKDGIAAGPEVYAEPGCVRRTASMVAQGAETRDVRVRYHGSVEFIALKIVVPAPK